ncbi:autotransporter domain-containing protein [Bradyrhizobium sp. WSM2254]|uniref:autotransporter outer membrane beta-barrel domain-containing protein n=1 Tax=Bradyrhizobium sp. WSM2254 TaxID=1188263 RepID=UPI001FD9DBD9|nr:autotransporter outer membrane beta-barrel domain-containing protein [Bradyrhizobium sp. WSM2254]
MTLVTVDTTTPNPAVINGTANSAAATMGSSTSQGLITATGAGTTWSINGITDFRNGTLSIENGAAVSSNNVANVIGTAGATVNLIVDGPGSSFTSSFDMRLGGINSTANLIIRNGGTVTTNGTADFVVAASAIQPMGTATALVSGAGSSWTVTGAMQIGALGHGKLTIENGGFVQSGGAMLGVNGVGGHTTGDVLVTGASSAWSISGALLVGNQGDGTLTLRNGGQVTATSASVAGQTGSLSKIVIGGDPGTAAAAPGTLNVPTVTFGAGTGSVVFNHTSNSYAFAPTITGAGSVEVENGTTILSATNTYTGATTISGGTLSVTGAITSSNVTVNGGTLNVTGSVSDSTVNAGGLLTGTGSVGDTTVNSGGTFAPGTINVPGTSMTVAGNLAFASGARYAVYLNPSTASFATITGSAQLGGATVDANLANGGYVFKKYTILTASGGVTGSFGSVNTNLPSTFKAALSYDANDAFLTLSLALAAPGNNGNQQAVGNAISNYFNSGGSIPLTFAGLTAAGLTQASGESATGSQQSTFTAMSQFMGLLTDPPAGRGNGINGASLPTGYAAESDQASAYAARRKTDAFAMLTKAPTTTFVQRWTVWAAGYGGSQSTTGNAVVGSNDTTSRIFGTAVGADYLFSPNTLAGFALAGGGTSFSVNNLGSGRSDLFQAGAYVRHTAGSAYITAALAYGWQSISTDRSVTVAGIDHLRAAFDANAYSGRLEGGHRFVAPWVGGVGITPYAAGQFTTFDLPAYAESVVTGTQNFALAYAAKSVTDLRSELGLRTDKSFAAANGILTVRSRLAWAHDFNPDRSIAATFQSLPGTSFVVNGAAQASDSALTTASIEMKWLNGWSAAATFEGEFSNVTSSYAGKGSVRYTW